MAARDWRSRAQVRRVVPDAPPSRPFPPRLQAVRATRTKWDCADVAKCSSLDRGVSGLARIATNGAGLFVSPIALLRRREPVRSSRDDYAGSRAARLRSSQPCDTTRSGGCTTRVNIARINDPPMTTIASGRCVCDPIPWESAAGISPSVATSVVMSTGRKRFSAASRAAFSIEWPSVSRNRWK